MRNHLDQVLHASIAALKFTALGGPIAMAMTGTGLGILGISFNLGGEHNDVILVLAGLFVVLGFVEWALARRFQAHERVEREDRESLINKVLRQNGENADRLFAQIEGIGAEYDGLIRRINELSKLHETLGPRTRSLELAVSKIGTDVDELKTWRARIGERLGALK